MIGLKIGLKVSVYRKSYHWNLIGLNIGLIVDFHMSHNHDNRTELHRSHNRRSHHNESHNRGSCNGNVLGLTIGFQVSL